jgi:hypothetical protein
MSTSIHLQNYLASYDIGLAKILRFTRRVLELFPFKWVISGRMAMILYAYMLNLQRPTFPNLNIDIMLNVSKNSGITTLEQSIITLMEQSGFQRIVDENVPDKVISFYHSICPSIRIDLRFMGENELFSQPLWIENRKGKLLYPLNHIENLIAQANDNVLRHDMNDTIQDEELKEMVSFIKHHQVNSQIELDFLEYIKSNLITYN